jgi:hypothetical protein
MRRRRRHAMNFGVLEKTLSEIKRLRKWRVMNARIGDDFTSLL